MKIVKNALIAGFTLAGLSTPALSEVWVTDQSHSAAHFKVKHMMVATVNGDITGVDAKLDINDKDITKSTVEATLETKTINTNNAKRDEHLRSPDFFDATKFPAIKFVSTKVSKDGKDGLKVAGNLTIRDITKPVTLEVEGPTKAFKDPWGNMKRGLSASTKINRKDFGLTWNKVLETGGVVVGEEVKIEIELELQHAAEKKPAH
ncbi:polyisoprenoid-binding protein [bacterium]|nr:polyisoprenoid-binding protein [bacterium]